MKKEIERLEGKMKQYIGKDACYGVKVYASELQNLTSHERSA